jgi:hypothetical protein
MAFCRETLEPPRVEVVGVEPKAVAGTSRYDRIRAE